MATRGIRVDITQIPAHATTIIAGQLVGWAGDIRSVGGRDGVLKDMVDVVQERVATNFEREGSTATGKWKALAPVTVSNRERLGYPGRHPILERTGNLRRVATSEAIWTFQGQTGTADAFVTGLPGAEYGRTHQFGYKEIPARPFLEVNADDMRRMEEMFEDWIERRLLVNLGGRGVVSRMG